jgi:16S rRNA (guanine527-N7)-methyltransferase
MHPERIAELLRPFLAAGSGVNTQSNPDRAGGLPDGGQAAALSSAQLEYISIYIDMLLRWNARINLTAVHQPEEIVTRHFGESLFVARHLFPAGMGHPGRSLATNAKPDSTIQPEEQDSATTNSRVIDVGSGAGFPGLPIKIWAPKVHLTLIESNHKKATFLKEVTRALTLTDVDVLTAPAEGFSGQAEIVTLRAVERFEKMLPVAARLVIPGGCLALLIGRSQVRFVHGLRGFSWSEPRSIPLSSNRILIIGSMEPS